MINILQTMSIKKPDITILFYEKLSYQIIQHLYIPYLLKPIPQHLGKLSNLLYGLRLSISKTVLLDLEKLTKA